MPAATTGRSRQSYRLYNPGVDSVGVGPLLVCLVQDRHGSGFAAWATVASTKSAYDVPWNQAKAMTIY